MGSEGRSSIHGGDAAPGSLCFGGELGRLGPNESIAGSRDALALVADEIGKRLGVRARPWRGKDRVGCGVGWWRLDDRAPERGRLRTLERGIDAACERGRVVHSRNAKIVESEEVDDGLWKTGVRVPLRLNPLLHRLTEHDQRDARTSDRLKTSRLQGIRHG